MSQNYLTKSEIASKLDITSISGTDFITKSELLATGRADPSKLLGYNDNDFIVDDDIVLQNKYTTIFIPNTSRTIHYLGYANWGYSFNHTVSGMWIQYITIMIFDRSLLDRGYNIRGRNGNETSRLSPGKCIGIPDISNILPESDNAEIWRNWYNTYNLDYFKDQYINNLSYPRTSILPSVTEQTLDLQSARYGNSPFYIITLDDLSVNQIYRTCGIVDSHTYVKSGSPNITANYAASEKFY